MRCCRLAVLALFVLAVLPYSVAAQRGVLEWSDVTGTVVGSGGQPLVGARVELADGNGLASPVLRVGVTDQAGVYLFPGLPPGQYEVRIVSGLQTLARTPFQLFAGRDSRLRSSASGGDDDDDGGLLALVLSRDVAGIEGLGTPSRASRASVAAVICALTCWFPSATRVANSPLN